MIATVTVVNLTANMAFGRNATFCWRPYFRQCRKVAINADDVNSVTDISGITFRYANIVNRGCAHIVGRWHECFISEAGMVV